ncbi:hypothetical protein ACWEVO_18965, partial [Micromonospora sp. NPDC003776]
KPDMSKLIPHGVQGAQSHITLNDEQVANAKAPPPSADGSASGRTATRSRAVTTTWRGPTR